MARTGEEGSELARAGFFSPAFRALPSAQRLRELQHRWQRVLVLTAVTGALTGLAVAGFEWITSQVLLEWVLDLPWGLQMVCPILGLGVAWAALRWLAPAPGTGPGTADEYIRNFHDPFHHVSLRRTPAKVVASIATLGSGGAMGMEGPSLYIGASIGSFVQRQFARFFSREDIKVLTVAGAAAGVSAIFKTPATGAIFALEVPYRSDLAARTALPALVASATSYLTFVAFEGTTPILAGSGSPAFDAPDLLGAIAIGLLAGGGARVFAWLVRKAKAIVTGWPAWKRLLLGGGGLAALVAASQPLFDETLVLGFGYQAIRWGADTRHAFELVALLFVLRALATSLTVAGGGAGGLFIPLVVQGTLLGRLVGEVAGRASTSLFPLVGAAAFLGAGYRTPIAAVMFVAESTGRPGFVVPALIATVFAQLVMGSQSVSPYQQGMRTGHVERRFTLPVRAAVVTGVHACPSDATVEELLHVHFVQARARSMPVVDGERLLGMVRLQDVAKVPRDERGTTTAADLLHADLPILRPHWTVRDAAAAMSRADVDRLPVVEDGKFLGVVTTAEIVRLDEILEATER